MSDERGIGVIGAGPAGLAAAWRLSSSGRRVRVYEARSEVGGRLRTERLEEASADVAVQLLSEGYSVVRELVDSLGLGSLVVPVPGQDAVWRKGGPHALRYGSARSMATSGALPPGLKVRMALRYLPFLERHGDVLDLNDPGRAAAAGLDTESIAAWGRREVGEEFVELLAYPLLASYYGVTPEETSAALFHALAHAGLGVTVQGVRGGVGALAASVAGALTARGVEVVTGRPVEAVEASSSGVALRVGGETVEHAAAVVAVPPAEAARLVAGAAWLDTIRTRATATLMLVTDGPVRPGWFGLTLPRRDPLGARVAAVCVQGEKETGLVPPERGALVIVPAPHEGPRWADAEPREALDVAWPVLDRVLPGVADRVTEARLVRLPGGVFIPSPGHFSRIRALDGVVAPRLVLAGDYLVAPTVEGAVRSGVRAADRLEENGALAAPTP